MDRPEQPVVSVVIPARDAAGTLAATLAALAAQTAQVGFEVIVVDDGSTDDTAAVAAAAGAHVVRGAAAGPAAARNRGAAASRGRVLAFTDADCAPEPGWLDAALAALDGADLVQGKVLPPPGAKVGPFDRHLTVLAEYGLYETANLVIRRELFDRLGGFESILRPRDGKELGEDVWLGWRARRAGARTTFSDAALVRHVVFERGPAGYVWERSRLRFFPQLVRHVPELRDTFLYRRVFLSRRQACLDLALAGVATAVLSRRPLALAAGVPYARIVADDASDARVAAVAVTADLVGAAALVLGSLRSRSLLM